MKRRNLLIGGVLVLVLLGAGVWYWNQQAGAANSATPRQTATLTRGELTATVSGAGNMIAPKQTELSFTSGGVPVTAVHVKVGDTVTQGIVLAEMEATQLERQVQIAQTNLDAAQAQLDELMAPASASALALAQAQVASAQASHASALANLQELQAPADANELQAARAQLAASQASFDSANAKSAMSNEQIIVARASLERARIALEAAQSAYNTVAWRDEAPSSSQAQELQAATIDYESAQATYALNMTELNNSAAKSAEASLANARATLQTLVAGASAQEIATAQAAVDSAAATLLQAQEDLKTLQDGASEIDLLQARGSVETAQKTLDDAKQTLVDAQIIAPFDGTVADVNTFVGQIANAGSAVITLVNVADLQTEISLSEVDVAGIEPGQDVTLIFDALNGREFAASVLAVSPLGVSNSGVVNYTVTIGLASPDPAILPGMTAQAAIITDRVTDALLAPNRSVRTVGNRRIMTLLFEGREIPLVVTTGLIGDSNTQILQATMQDGTAVNLQDGDTVLLNTTTSTGTTGTGTFGGSGGGNFVVPAGGAVPIGRP